MRIVFLRQGLIIVVLGALVGVAANALAPWGIPWIARPRTLAAAPDSALAVHPTRQDDVTGEIAEPLSITLRQAKILYDRRRAIFVDARPPYEYDEGHIAGAINIPWDEVEYYQAAIERLPRDSVIVVYCDGSSCDLSIHLGDALARRGFRQVRVFFGGWAEWLEAGYPVEGRRGGPSSGE